MEPTPSQSKKFVDYYHGQQDGTGPAPSGPTRPGQKMTDGISALLAGKPAPSDRPDAPAGVDSAVWEAAQKSASDPSSPDYDLASALLTVAQALADAQKGSQP
jgi:hypothetical protein